VALLALMIVEAEHFFSEHFAQPGGHGVINFF